MPATVAQKLNELITQKNSLADNLAAQGVTAGYNETFNTLVPKVAQIVYGGEIAYGSGNLAADGLGLYPQSFSVEELHFAPKRFAICFERAMTHELAGAEAGYAAAILNIDNLLPGENTVTVTLYTAMDTAEELNITVEVDADDTGNTLTVTLPTVNGSKYVFRGEYIWVVTGEQWNGEDEA